jgi:hypothetical protein
MTTDSTGSCRLQFQQFPPYFLANLAQSCPVSDLCVCVCVCVFVCVCVCHGVCVCVSVCLSVCLSIVCAIMRVGRGAVTCPMAGRHMNPSPHRRLMTAGWMRPRIGSPISHKSEWHASSPSARVRVLGGGRRRREHTCTYIHVCIHI